TALPGTIQHWNLNLNPPHTRNSGYLPKNLPIPFLEIAQKQYQNDRTTRPTDEGHTAGEAVCLTRT
ncbi:hypothetical protein, partial [Burkholderia multivorans]|uniref:hypothetical protein n=1 Tax=Burkholderia multivorans TaxID=87883 RepID=UPI00286FB6B1